MQNSSGVDSVVCAGIMDGAGVGWVAKGTPNGMGGRHWRTRKQV